MRRTSARRFAQATLAVAGLGAALASGAGLAGSLAADGLVHPALIAGGFLVAVGALWILGGVLTNHFRTLERLRGLAIAIRGADTAPNVRLDASDTETAALADELLDTAAMHMRERQAPDDRLAAVLAGVHEGIVAVTDQGQVSLVNSPAKALLGSERVKVGTSIYAALLRESLVEAFSHARAAAIPVSVRLTTVEGDTLDGTVADMGRFRGYVICIPTSAAPMVCAIEHDLALHDQPPAVAALSDGTPLTELPVTIVDTETTGLDPARDRIVALGAIRMHGTRLYRAVSLDLLVNPGAPIPPESTLIHGITDATVADAPAWREQAERLLAISAGTVVVGHNIGFDLAMFRAEAARAGIAWSDPPVLDTVHLAAVLEPKESEFDLEQIAVRHGVEVQGRHTALGDCLIAAAIWQRLIPRLASHGVTTLGGARAYAAKAGRIVARQRAAGW